MKTIIKGILLATISLYCSAFASAADNNNEAFNIEYRVPDVPQTMTFAGETIDLSRYDMYERIERELTTACYMHATTMLTIKRANRYMPGSYRKRLQPIGQITRQGSRHVAVYACYSSRIWA